MIPFDVLIKIFSHFTVYSDLINSSLVCKLWYETATQEKLCRPLLVECGIENEKETIVPHSSLVSCRQKTDTKVTDSIKITKIKSIPMSSHFSRLFELHHHQSILKNCGQLSYRGYYVILNNLLYSPSFSSPQLSYFRLSLTYCAMFDHVLCFGILLNRMGVENKQLNRSFWKSMLKVAMNNQSFKVAKYIIHTSKFDFLEILFESPAMLLCYLKSKKSSNPTTIAKILEKGNLEANHVLWSNFDFTFLFLIDQIKSSSLFLFLWQMHSVTMVKGINRHIYRAASLFYVWIWWSKMRKLNLVNQFCTLNLPEILSYEPSFLKTFPLFMSFEELQTILIILQKEMNKDEEKSCLLNWMETLNKNQHGDEDFKKLEKKLGEIIEKWND